MEIPRRVIGDMATAAVLLGLVGAVYFLPPDTSLAQVEEAGLLRACVPNSYPPLVTGDPAAPGLDIALLQAITERMGIRLVLNTNSAMGRDFNPRNWRVTRAQCQVLAGGVVVSTTTRSFLDTTPPHLETGWALIDAGAPVTLSGATVGVFAGLVGLDRIGLSRYLREQGAQLAIVSSAGALADGLESGRFDAGVTEAITARQIAGMQDDWRVRWLPGDLGRYPIALGLWKGDLTLKRRLVEVIDALETEGIFDQLMERYDIAPIEGTFGSDAEASEQ